MRGVLTTHNVGDNTQFGDFSMVTFQCQKPNPPFYENISLTIWNEIKFIKVLFMFLKLIPLII